MPERARPTYYPAPAADLSQLDRWDRGPTPNFVPVPVRTLLLRLLAMAVLFGASLAVVVGIGYGAVALVLSWIAS